jgi:hypothetical protein
LNDSIEIFSDFADVPEAGIRTHAKQLLSDSKKMAGRVVVSLHVSVIVCHPAKFRSLYDSSPHVTSLVSIDQIHLASGPLQFFREY